MLANIIILIILWLTLIFFISFILDTIFERKVYEITWKTSSIIIFTIFIIAIFYGIISATITLINN